MRKKILISTGGSGGHVNPAIALYEHLKDQYDIILTTDLRGKKFLNKNFKNYTIIDTPKLNNKILLPLNILIVIFLTFKSIVLLRKKKIKYLFSTGGYMSIPICLASKFLKIDIYLLEPNMVLGRANKYFLNTCKKIFCYSKKIKKFPKNKEFKQVVINPIVRKKFFIQHFNFLKKKKFEIVVIGGSQSASIFNNFFYEVFKNINNRYPLKIFHQTSKQNINNLQNLYLINKIENKVFSYDENLFELIKSSDFCITRAGASTLSELVILNIPFLAIPLPNSKDNHQLENSFFYRDKGFGWIMGQNELSQKKVEDFLINIFRNNSEYNEKKLNMKNFTNNNSWIKDNKKILDEIE